MNKTKPVIFGIKSTLLSKKEVKLFKDNNVFGFILFSRNIESRNQVIELTKSLKNLYPERDVPIFIDQEGGRVARIKPPIIDNLYPPANYFASLYDQDKSLAINQVQDNYTELMADLKSLNIDSPCAPVCDILYSDGDNVIGDRSFGDNVDKVIDLCQGAINGIHHSGGLPFIKHIPGHGRATVDSHFELPIIRTGLEELEATDFKIFKTLAAKNDVWGMTAHIIYTALDPDNTITTSPIAIDYIRNKLKFKGNLVSDDLCMYALHGLVGKKCATLKQVIKLTEAQKDWKAKYSRDLKNLFAIDINQNSNPLDISQNGIVSDSSKISNSLIIELCKEKLLEIQPEFLETLAKVSKLSIKAGCDIILHCSGDFKEMTTICDVL